MLVTVPRHSKTCVMRYYWLCLSDSLFDAEQITTRLMAPLLHKQLLSWLLDSLYVSSAVQLYRIYVPSLGCMSMYVLCPQVLHSVEECSETLAFASEPVLASLANILAAQEERPQGGPPPHAREYHFLDMELKYGLLQVSNHRYLSY
jgi:hypothetical protein